MNEDALERLRPFIYRKSARQRVILFLLADGWSVGDLVRMSVAELRALKMPDEIAVDRDNLLVGVHSGPAFVFPNSKVVPHNFYYRLVKAAAIKATGRPMSYDSFREYICK